MQTKCRQEMDKQVEEEIGAQLLPRDQALSVFEKLQKLQRKIDEEFRKDEKFDELTEEKQAEKLFELEYK